MHTEISLAGNFFCASMCVTVTTPRSIPLLHTGEGKSQMAEPHPVGSMLALADVVLPGVVITRSARTIQVDATDATAAQWATAMEWVADRAPEEARCDMFCDDTREVWHFSW